MAWPSPSGFEGSVATAIVPDGPAVVYLWPPDKECRDLMRTFASIRDRPTWITGSPQRLARCRCLRPLCQASGVRVRYHRRRGGWLLACLLLDGQVIRSGHLARDAGASVRVSGRAVRTPTRGVEVAGRRVARCCGLLACGRLSAPSCLQSRSVLPFPTYSSVHTPINENAESTV